jgi:hypothetical protein
MNEEDVSNPQPGRESAAEPSKNGLEAALHLPRWWLVTAVLVALTTAVGRDLSDGAIRLAITLTGAFGLTILILLAALVSRRIGARRRGTPPDPAGSPAGGGIRNAVIGTSLLLPGVVLAALLREVDMPLPNTINVAFWVAYGLVVVILWQVVRRRRGDR